MKKFVILTTQRSGSTLLWRYLDQHPEIKGHGEVFMRGMNRPDSYRTFIRNKWFGRVRNRLNKGRMIASYMKTLVPVDNQTKAFGFKLMYTQMNPYMTQYIKDNDFYIIHLIRKNFLKTILSRETAKARSMYHASPEDSVKAVKVTLDTETLMSDLNTINNEVSENREVFNGCPYTEVYYEDLVENKDEVSKSIFEFLGLDPNGISEMEFPLKKINPDNLEDLIENFDEVERVVSQSEFKAMLD